MQREKITYPIVKKYRPFLFWEECRFCHKEFRKENGFVIKDIKKCRAINEYPIYTSYCCSKCANSIEEVKLKIDDEDIVKKMRNIKPPSPGSGI
ncbi:hypothetical protein [Clostridium neonatale]|uniref:hypothetical protein n=1 Tax=Clostridium neonatale TaxID=137838 RepID=UPI001B35EE6B|nr:hypothetical protein [Clostridium neonatale]MBP8311254.1 hypothetical protein [Clostridium neonatale]CAG9714074.1 conserved hypothetical protein [Clostridium neonatale]CAI3705629.1 conserved hypothetical protein [Clostridium neonatale]CAI3712713.1 conserved hypothetical protein [Clostridium neonatale]CAI3714113.1 conserved hypothetical protein [Clostridium neonatale]